MLNNEEYSGMSDKTLRKKILLVKRKKGDQNAFTQTTETSIKKSKKKRLIVKKQKLENQANNEVHHIPESSSGLEPKT